MVVATIVYKPTRYSDGIGGGTSLKLAVKTPLLDSIIVKIDASSIDKT